MEQELKTEVQIEAENSPGESQAGLLRGPPKKA